MVDPEMVSLGQSRDQCNYHTLNPTVGNTDFVDVFSPAALMTSSQMFSAAQKLAGTMLGTV